ncbi:MAG: alpha-ketoglutarate-dependent dioxygenase AlkB [Candidatus Xenobia bacterium]
MQPDVLVEEGFVPDPDALLAWMMAHTEWDRRIQARLTASFGRPYNYAGLDYPPVTMPGPLAQLCDRLESRLGFRPDNCLANYYPDGHSKMGFHADNVEELADGTGVAIVSLGGERPLKFRLMGNPEVRYDLTQRPGSMLYMPQQVNRQWVHAILRRRHAEPRISLTFRQLR